jgi:hypothetical protein
MKTEVGQRVMKLARSIGLYLLIPISGTLLAGESSNSMTFHARGTFNVAVVPLSPAPADGLNRYSINKEIHGELEATTKGEMFSGGDPKQGVAGYVAIEVVTGTLQGRHGSFALQQFATMDANGAKMTVVVVPGSGTGELKGISGTFAIKNADGQHSYDLEYRLPSSK